MSGSECGFLFANNLTCRSEVRQARIESGFGDILYEARGETDQVTSWMSIYRQYAFSIRKELQCTAEYTQPFQHHEG